MVNKKSLKSRNSNKRPRVEENFFINTEAQKLYEEVFCERPHILEREVVMDELPNEIQLVFKDRGWEPIFSNFILPSTPMIKEFYSNIHDISVSENSFSTYLRGQVFKVSPEVISRVVGIPRVQNPDYPYANVDADFLNEIANTILDGRRGKWVYKGQAIKTNQFSTETNMIFRIQSTNIYPVAHLSSIALPKLKLLYALKKGHSVDLPSHICICMLDSFQHSKKSYVFPFGCLIARLVHGLQIAYPKLSPVSIGQPIRMVTYNQSKAHLLTCTRGPKDPPPRPPSSMSDDMSFIRSSIAQILERQTRMETRMEAQFADVLRSLQTLQVRQDHMYNELRDYLHDDDDASAGMSGRSGASVGDGTTGGAGAGPSTS